MGFLQGLGRLLAGKPVFTTEDSTGSLEDKGTDGKTPVDERGYKIMPEVRILRTKPILKESELEVWMMIQNVSDATIFLDKINFLGYVFELDRQLTAGSSHDFRIYKGQAFASKPSTDTDIDYRLESSGDYFRAHFDVEFYMQDGHFLPKEFHPEGHVRDI